MSDTLPEVIAREQEVEREWQWLHDALHVVSQTHARTGRGDLHAFRLMQEQLLRLGKRRVELLAQRAKFEQMR